MEIFLKTILDFPTVVYSFLLVIVIVYWIFAILGAIDIEVFDFDVDTDVEPSGISGFLVSLGLTGVPITVIISFITVFSWLVTYLISLYLLHLLPTGLAFWVGSVVAINVAFIIAVPITIVITKPMRRLFKVQYATQNNQLLGETAKVKTSKVTEKFGEVELDRKGEYFIFQARAMVPNDIKKGESVILVEYDDAAHIYWVKSLKTNK